MLFNRFKNLTTRVTTIEDILIALAQPAALYDTYAIDIPMGNTPGYSSVNKYGRNPDIDTAAPEDIWGVGGLWVPPTEARVHDIASTSANDSGVVVSSGVATGGSTVTIVDSAATFVSDGVLTGDVVLNDTTMEHSIVVSATETTLTCHTSRHGGPITSGNDSYRVVNADSTGASVVHVHGLTLLMVEQEEFVVMAGITNVSTVHPYWRINRVHTDGAAGRTVSNLGDITGTASTDGTITFKMTAGFGGTSLAVYTVPAGKTALMTQLYANINKQGNTAGAMADLTLRSTPFASTDGSGSRVEHYFSVAVDGSSNADHPFIPYKRFEEQTDIWIRCDGVSDNNTDISAGFDLILIDN